MHYCFVFLINFARCVFVGLSEFPSSSCGRDHSISLEMCANWLRTMHYQNYEAMRIVFEWEDNVCLKIKFADFKTRNPAILQNLGIVDSAWRLRVFLEDIYIIIRNENGGMDVIGLGEPKKEKNGEVGVQINCINFINICSRSFWLPRNFLGIYGMHFFDVLHWIGCPLQLMLICASASERELVEVQIN